jgi:UDP-glucose 4-epimerase
VRDFVHVSDLAGAHLAALDYLLAGGESADFNLGSGCGHSVQQVLSSVERVTQRPIAAQAAPRRPGDPALLICDSRKANSVLGWRPRHQSLDRIVADAAAWEARRHG